ncbi:MAG: hypothetical protein ACJ8F7_11705 [Gemmataceae bacterium]
MAVTVVNLVAPSEWSGRSQPTAQPIGVEPVPTIFVSPPHG